MDVEVIARSREIEHRGDEPATSCPSPSDDDDAIVAEGCQRCRDRVGPMCSESSPFDFRLTTMLVRYSRFANVEVW